MGWDGGGGGGTRVICWIPNQSLMSHRRQSLMTLVAEYPPASMPLPDRPAFRGQDGEGG